MLANKLCCIFNPYLVFILRLCTKILPYLTISSVVKQSLNMTKTSELLRFLYISIQANIEVYSSTMRSNIFQIWWTRRNDGIHPSGSTSCTFTDSDLCGESEQQAWLHRVQREVERVTWTPQLKIQEHFSCFKLLETTHQGWTECLLYG